MCKYTTCRFEKVNDRTGSTLRETILLRSLTAREDLQRSHIISSYTKIFLKSTYYELEG